jgi:stage V sporulation protein AD
VLIGKQTLSFSSRPRILGTGTAVGSKEGEGALAGAFDLVHEDSHIGQPSWEKAERVLFERAVAVALKKAGLAMEDMSVVISGDLLAQNITSAYAARGHGRPLLGIFSACATSMQALTLAAQEVEAGDARYALAAVSSHNSTAERQFRFPTEYGAQKPSTAHCTVTGAAAAVVGHGLSGPVIELATRGSVVDLGVKSPWEMGAAMAPAAAETIAAHLQDAKRGPEDYDVIATGDLGTVGAPIARELLHQRGIVLRESAFIDCGALIYRREQPEVFSGGSGPACCPCVTFAHLLPMMIGRGWRRILVVATGALHSPVSVAQGETIPCIAHAVAFAPG